MVDKVEYNGVEISTIPVINRPSYFLVNNYGNESYMTIIEPMEEFKRTPERVVLASAYKSVTQLAAAFKSQVEVGGTKEGYNRKDIKEVFFMGFRWKWRPNHKSFYGGITVGYELLPLIARWIVLTGVMSNIENHNPAYLPARYKNGTGKGFGGAEIDAPDIGTKEAVEADIAAVTETVSKNTLIPISHCYCGGIARAAQLNIIPKEAFDLYDKLMGEIWSDNRHAGMQTNPICYYTSAFEVGDGGLSIIGAFYGGRELPVWAVPLKRREENGVKVTVATIKADNLCSADELMQEMIKNIYIRN